MTEDEKAERIAKLSRKANSYAIGLVDECIIRGTPEFRTSVKDVIALAYMQGWKDRLDEELGEGKEGS